VLKTMSRPRGRFKARVADRHQGQAEIEGEVECILVLQGGGALGAYQAGAYEALDARGATPHWVAGISIGAINAALIAGNRPNQRIPSLREFWETTTSISSLIAPPVLPSVALRRAFNQANASMVALCGLPGFFVPRIPAAPFHPHGTPGALSYYDTAPLRATLNRLIDFDLLNDGPIRLSIGAVNVRTGNFAYFDTAEQRLDARHIMASTALPPGFPPVEIDGECYWDGGIVSNTPLQYVLDQPGSKPRVAFQVDLFACEGPMPTNLSQVAEREKDIRYSSRTRLNTNNAIARHALAQAARRLTAKLPASYARDPDVRTLRAFSAERAVTVVHLIYRRQPYETQSEDYEFSRTSMQEHWNAGRADVVYTLNHPGWRSRATARDGVHVFDLTRDRVRLREAVA
jgi:NTE family protein